MNDADTVDDGSTGAPHRVLITISVTLATTMQALDTTIANVALPHIQGSLSATQDQMTWVLTSYIIAAAIMTPLGAWLATKFGRRRIFLISIAGFTLASVLCGLAQSLPQIVVARVLQGLCGAALVPMSQAVLLDINPPAQHGKAMATWVMAVTVGPILGPLLGGWLTENYDWRWVFYINVPVGILSFLGILSFMSETSLRRTRFDFFGFVTLSLAIGALQLMLDRGQLQDWFGSVQILITAAVAALSTYLFVVHMLTTPNDGFVSPSLFKDRNFLTGSLFNFLVGGILYATLTLLPPLLQGLLQYPVVFTGLVTAPRGLGTLLAMFIVGRLIGRIDIRLIISAGFSLTALSLWQMTHFYLQMDSSSVVWSGISQGLGLGCVFVPLSSVAFATLPAHLRNEGTAVFSLVRNIGSSVGISAIQTLLTRNTQILHARLAERVTGYAQFPGPRSSAAPWSVPELARVNEMITRQAAMLAYNNNFKLMMLLALGAIPLVVLLRGAAAQTAGNPLAID